MNYENVLLIGGPLDGQWRTVLQGVRDIRFSTLKHEFYPTDKFVNEPVDAAVVEYRRVPVQSDQGFQSSVFVFGDIDPMVALINGYRKP